MMNIVELVTVEMKKEIAENRITAVEYMKLVKKLRNNEESDIMPIILDYIEELTEQVMSFPAMEERSEFEHRYTTQLMDMIEFLQDITDKETIINKDTIDKLNEQLCTAVAKGDFVTATKITELINNLQSIIEVVDEEETITESEEELVVVELDKEMTIFKASCYTTGQLDEICGLIGLDNPISDKWKLPISTVTKEELDELELLQELIPIGWAEVEWDENDADDYYYDCYQEALGGLECLIHTIRDIMDNK